MKRKTDPRSIAVVVPFFVLCIAGAIGAGCAYAGESDPPQAAVALTPSGQASSGEVQKPVELNGDTVEYKAAEGKFVATGNVILRQNNAKLFCDQLEFYREKQEAHAMGHVVVISDKGTVWADKGFYNFSTKKGEFTNARILASPFYGRAVTISKINENYYVLSDGYLTTSDYDDPGWRVRSHQIELRPGDEAVARRSTLFFGKVPVMYLPKYTQDLKDDRPHLSVIPGYTNKWGAFVMTSYRVYPFDGIETEYHFDPREKKGLAWGVDVKYHPGALGDGLVKTYYMNEHSRKKHIWENDPAVTETERYRIEWRHKVDIDPQTSAIMQYYKLTDDQFLKDYFEREYRTDQSPPTFFLLTRVMPRAMVSLRVDARANSYESLVERLPEVNFSLNNQQIGDTGVYFKSSNTASSLVKKDPRPSDVVHRTMRFDTDNELSRPFKIAFLEMRPYIGTEQTYYSRSLAPQDDNAVRGVFKTGMDISTKFYRIYDANFDQWGMKIDKLRHIITPTVTYQFQTAPTLPSTKLFPFDATDGRVQTDKFSLGLENKLQTKRNGQAVDLFRSLLTTDFRLKDNRALVTTASSMSDIPTKGSFGDVTLDNEFYPNEFVTFHSDATYSNDNHNLQTANVDLCLKDNKRWEFDISRRYTYHDDDPVTTQLSYTFNPKWRAVVYDRWNVDRGQWQEQQYSLVRDLHSWEAEFSIRNKSHYDSNGTEIWVIFRIKAFPSVNFNGGSSFSKSKPGAHS